MSGAAPSSWRTGAVLAGVVLVWAALIDAQPAQDDESYPHAYPRPGVEKRFENERVIIWEVVWLDGVPMPYHRHRYDMTGVFLRWGPLRVTRPDATFTVSQDPFDIPSVFLLRKGVTHKEEGIGSPERHSIMIDLKDYHPPRQEQRTDIPPAFPRDDSTVMLDEDRVTIWDVQLEAGQEVPLHVHNRDTVAVFSRGAPFARSTRTAPRPQRPTPTRTSGSGRRDARTGRWWSTAHRERCSTSYRTSRTARLYLDATPPVLTQPPDILNVPAPDANGALVTYALPTATDNDDPNPVVSCLPASGSLFPLGSTTVTCTATDAVGNTSSVTFTVEVVDATPPAVVCPAPSQVVADPITGQVPMPDLLGAVLAPTT